MTETNPGLPEVFRTKDFEGWEVVDATGRKLGTIADLLIDGGGRVRFVDVGFGFPKKHVLVPEERFEWGVGRLVVDAFIPDPIASLPPYDPSRVLDAALLSELASAFPTVYDPFAEEWRSPTTEARVVPLPQAKGFRLEKGAPDLRGWNVFGADGERVGVIAQLLVDPTAMRVRYVAVDVHDDLFRLRDDRHVLVPLESVDLKERSNDAWVEGLSAAAVAALPAYSGGVVPPAMEMAIQRAFAGQTADALPPASDGDNLLSSGDAGTALSAGSDEAARLPPPPADEAPGEF